MPVMRILRLFWAAWSDMLDDLALLTICSLCWSVLSLPLPILALLAGNRAPGLAGLLVGLGLVPLALATAGLAGVAHRLAEGYASSLRDFLGGMRRQALRSLLVLGAWLASGLALLAGIRFYGGLPGGFGLPLVLLVLFGLVVWLALLLYLPPLLHLQADYLPGGGLLRLARSALLMVLGRPFLTFGTLLLLAPLVALALLVPPLLVLVAPGLLALCGAHVTLDVLREVAAYREAQHAAAASASTDGAPTGTGADGRRGQVGPK